MLKVVQLVKVEEELCKCIKWDQECINKFKRIVIIVRDKDKLLLKEVNARLVLERKLCPRKKYWKYLLRKEYLMVALSFSTEKAIKCLRQLQEISFLLFKKKLIKSLPERELICS